MAHPKMFSEDDPYLTEIREICLSFPEATEKVSHGQLAFRAGKVFAEFWNSDYLYKKSGAQYGLIFKPDEEERQALLQDGRFVVPPYWGPYGWLCLDLDATKIDWQEVRELIDSSYRQIALKRMLKQLDELDRDN